MTQKDRDRLVVLKKAQKRLITQRQVAERWMLGKLMESGDGWVLHGLRGRTSNRLLRRELREQAVDRRAFTAGQKGASSAVLAPLRTALVRGLRVAGACTLAQATAYPEQEFGPWWNQHLVVLPAKPADAHRSLGPERDLVRTLCPVHPRQVANDYTLRPQGIRYQIARGCIRSGLRGAVVRLDGSVAVAYQVRSGPGLPGGLAPSAAAPPEHRI